MSSLSIGLSGLLVSQRMIDLTGQNIANADTPSYHRQVGELAGISAGSSIGNGVELTSITRVIDSLLENATVRNNSAQSASSTQLDGLNQLQAYLAPGAGSLNDTLANFFNAAEQLSAQPDDLTQRRVFLAAANDLTNGLNSTAANLKQMGSDLGGQAKTLIAQVNSLATQIGQLNQQIHDTTATGGAANNLMDQRDDAISQLSQLIDIRTVPQDYGQVNVLAGGTPLVLNSSATSLAVDVNSQNQTFLHAANSSQPTDVTGGKLGGILALLNTTLPQVQGQFGQFAQGLVTQIDQIQASGLGLNGPLTTITSQRPVANTNLPLAAANLPFPVTAGNLYVTMTNLATGQRSMNRVSIDPATQSLSAVAGTLSTIPNLQAVVDPQGGKLNLIARPGYGIDFTGNFSSKPDTQAITGTATPTFDGAYTGPSDDTLNFSFVGSGTIGVTPNLALEVRNGAGTLLTSLNVGQGYEAGTDLQNVLGVNVNLSNGTVNNGDTFSLNVAAKSDTTGLLSALGLNSFFVGTGVGNLAVNPVLLDHPEYLALSKTGQPGDGSNLAQLIALRDQPVLDNGLQTFQQFLEGVIGNVGTQTQDMQTRKSAYDSLGQQLDAQRQSASGVDPNEELMKLVQYQRAYQLSAHFVAASSQSFDEFIQLFSAPINI